MAGAGEGTCEPSARGAGSLWQEWVNRLQEEHGPRGRSRRTMVLVAGAGEEAHELSAAGAGSSWHERVKGVMIRLQEDHGARCRRG
ncbi:hypothetical protein NDU88_008460 [Pleurodeles waltl]|uniref:Uncharacterized protein n=1 Tax=Pleurodeles waltl TaxID=8319 RepID=A0AAV7N982_PLEWA|nr:hypothetical protein NDU88_008460 [Pleurodeles waltl]